MRRKKVDAETLTNQASKLISQSAGMIRTFVQIWEPEHLEEPSKLTESNFEEDGKQKDLRQPRLAMYVIRISSVDCIFISVERKCTTK